MGMIQEKGKGIGKMRSEKGITLVELVVAMFVMSIIMTGIYSAYYSQQKSFVVQDEVAQMQQNLRAAMFLMVREIRMAGCNPTGGASAGIVTSDPNTINFTLDLRGKASGDADGLIKISDEEDITYSLVGSEIKRDTGSGPEIVAENIDWLHFDYLDENGAITGSPMLIRSVQITVVARTGRGDLGYVNTTRYDDLDDSNADDFYIAPGDDFRRKRLSTNIKCRNLGL
jgi:type IV pilus assembly protein PilW